MKNSITKWIFYIICFTALTGYYPRELQTSAPTIFAFSQVLLYVLVTWLFKSLSERKLIDDI